jgi:hypothetical protein
MKKLMMISLALLMACALFAGCASSGSSKTGGSTPKGGQAETTAPAAETSETPVPTAVEPTPSESAASPADYSGIADVGTDKYEYKSDYIDVRLEVPKLTGLSDSAVMRSINAIFGDIMAAASHNPYTYAEHPRLMSKAIQSSLSPSLCCKTQAVAGTA